MELLELIKKNAQKHFKRIVLPEGLIDERTMRAADQAIAEKTAQIIILGNKDESLKKAKELGLKNLESATFVDPKNHAKKEQYINMMVELRKAKGLTKEEAAKLIEDPLYLGSVMIKAGDADGEVAGAMNTTANVLRPALQYVKTLPGITVVSGAFIMILQDKTYGENGIMVFADCAVHPAPTDKELGEIAVATARTTRAIAGFEPRIAMLSFSTKGSAKHALCDKVINAVKYAKELDPSLQIDGEFQADAAIVPSVGKSKAPGSELAGKANVLVFPDLQSGNICYKLVQRLAKAEAIGPILQGMAAPINDLSRGCSVSDVFNMICITANQAAVK
jgi:phosphate acetyltransferase